MCNTKFMCVMKLHMDKFFAIFDLGVNKVPYNKQFRLYGTCRINVIVMVLCLKLKL